MPKQDRNWLVEHILEQELRTVAERYARGRMLDIGCGTKPYQALFAPFVAAHVGLDHAPSRHGTERVDLVGTAYDIPVADQEFDTAICTAVLEHLEEPERALAECHRVLKPGGTAIYAVPFIWHVHEEPRDFFRFSRYGMQHLFEKTGFEVLEIKALSGFWVTFGQLLSYNLYRLDRGLLRRAKVVAPLAWGLQRLALGLDKLDRTEQWTWMYLAVARRR
ncbi:MAG: class I SAM-dependent methyltransferase [Myxococcales bacterium]